MRASHGEWLSWQLDYDTAVRAYWKLLARRTTGILANLTDDLTHEDALLELQSLGDANYYSRLLAPAKEWVGFASLVQAQFQCLDPPPSSVEEVASSPSVDAAKCPDSLAGAKIGIKISAEIDFSFSCEKIAVEISAWPSMLTPFASIGFGRGGEVMVYIGSKLSVKSDFSPAVASAKSGAYVRVGRDGAVTDIGWRVQAGDPGVKISDFNGKIAAVSSMDFSFVGIFQ